MADLQLVLTSGIVVIESHSSTPVWRRALVIPAYVAAVSFILIVLRVTASFGPVKRFFAKSQEEESVLAQDPRTTDTSTGLLSAVKGHVNALGGPQIFVWRVMRMLSVFALLGLSVATFAQDEESRVGGSSFDALSKHWGKKHHRKHKKSHTDGMFTKHEWVDLVLCLTYLYASFLAVFTVVSRRSGASTASAHLAILLLVIFSVYAYRDIWPLATYTLTPEDLREGPLLWAKVALLGFAAILVPLAVPRQYRPYNPKEPSTPSPEQTASILSMSIYSFLDPVIFLANRTPHISYEELPVLSDHDETRNLVHRSFKHLDVFSGAKKRHLFFGLMSVFAKEYVVMSIMMIIRVMSAFLAPVGINRLLNYLETHGEGAVVRPWVWVTGLFWGPFVGSLAMQWYIFITTGTLVRTEAILTQLVFEHALRIRMKAETSEDIRSTPGTPDTASLVEEPGSDASGSGSGDETLHSGDSQSTTSKGKKRQPSVPEATSDHVKKDDEQPNAAKAGNLVGKINNLISTDLNNITSGRDFLFIVLYTPAQCAISIWFLYTILGWSAFVGMAVMVLLFPVPGYVAGMMQGVQKETMNKTDARVQAATETMSVLRMIKLFGWEQKMSKRLQEKRDEEVKWIKFRAMLNLSNNIINFVIPIAQMIASFTTFTVIMKRDLSPSIVFSAMAVFDLLRDQLHMVFYMLTPIVQGKVSLDRLTTFLQETELLDEFNNSGNGEAHVMLSDASRFDKEVIGFHDASFTWSNDTVSDGTLTPSRRRFVLRIEDELVFKRGSINLVVGPTGSGKTSLLMALLGELHFVPLTPGSWFNLPRQGGVAYAAQESWVQNETIRDNILFGSAFDEDRYNKVIYQCGLKRDLTLFDAGDRTEVGEKGLTLSGGQKARVTLARAIYSSAEVLLLDDVLAALDVHTAKWIVNKCFKGDLVRGRTVILVTHNIAMATPIADYVVSLGVDGHIASRGTVSDALAVNKALQHEVQEEKEVIEKSDKEVDHDDPDGKSKQADGKLIVAEEVALGHVSWSALNLYFKGLGGNFAVLFWITFVGGYFINDFFSSLQTWFLGHWAEQYDLRPSSEVSVSFYLGIYALLLLCGIVAYACASLVYVQGTVRASKKIHKELVDSILGTTLRWLDITPTSRVITRCTQDIGAVDGPVAHNFDGVVEVTAAMTIKLAAVVIVTPIFLVPGIIISVMGGWCGQLYMAAQLAVKREMSNAKAPVVGHFGAAISGLTSIRAYGAQNPFRLESYGRINRYTRAGRTYYNLNRWVSLRIDLLGGLFSAALAAYLIYGPRNILPSNTGFALTQAVSFSGMILWWVRIFNEFEVNGNSLERIQAYIDIEQEPRPTTNGTPPAYWPASGALRVEKLSARYSSDGPKVLHDLSFEIKSGERVGIVGRTGSGKSSLTLSLLRCIFNEGTIYYDGLATDKINLDALRSNITIIPQVPELLSGTLRQNLDPFGERDDATLNAALRAAGLFSLQNEDDESRITLDSQIASGGGNMSVGQRQILALARAIVRGSKLLILDEATSSIDYETDSIIQTSLRNELGPDVTLVTVAHRLQTIMDADKILVLDAGHLVEFDTPSALLKKEDGMLKSLVDESGDKETLYAMAAGKGRSS
ncbi:hypothetical protein OF83DRAFT_1118292 [Amylostereum chailletii]|nr:hypothetical protein OF83DRAFT_1118292 [Amylostereum chailletii]